eukprot:1947319-Pyramimonas_sp.AAC.1
MITSPPPRLRRMSWLDKTQGMRSFERRLDRQRVRTHVPDRMLRAGEGPRCRDLELDPLRGATVQYPCARRAGTGAPTARPGRRTDARGMPADRMEPAGAQHVEVAQTCAPIVAISVCVGIAFRWMSRIAHIFSSRLCRTRPDLSRPNLSNNSWPVKPRGPRKPDWTEKR